MAQKSDPSERWATVDAFGASLPRRAIESGARELPVDPLLRLGQMPNWIRLA
jgi:hypothetical protein